MILFLAAILFILCGAVLGRVDGGGILKFPEWGERSLIMFAFVLACVDFAGIWSIFAFAGVFGIATGHGQYFLERVRKPIEPEKVDRFVSLFFGEDPRTSEVFKEYRKDWRTAKAPVIWRLNYSIDEYGFNRLYWRCVFGMFTTGLIVGIPAFVLSMVFGQTEGCLFLLTGVVKSVSYMVGFKFFENTESAEYINGGARNALCLAVMII